MVVAVKADTLLIICVAWSMKIIIGRVRPLTKHDPQHVDAQRSLLVGRPLVFSGRLFQARGDWALVPTNFFHSGVAH